MLITKLLCQPAAVELLVADFCRYGAYPALWSVFGVDARSLRTGYRPAEGMLVGACVRLWVVWVSVGDVGWRRRDHPGLVLWCDWSLPDPAVISLAWDGKQIMRMIHATCILSLLVRVRLLSMQTPKARTASMQGEFTHYAKTGTCCCALCCSGTWLWMLHLRLSWESWRQVSARADVSRWLIEHGLIPSEAARRNGKDFQLIAHILTGAIGFILSTAIIVIFGEIVPQSTCSRWVLGQKNAAQVFVCVTRERTRRSGGGIWAQWKYAKITQLTCASTVRYALAIGGKSVWLVHIFKYLLFIVAKPIALVLDLALGEEMGTVHNKRQIVQLVRFHENAKVRHACNGPYICADIHTSLSTLPRMSSFFSVSLLLYLVWRAGHWPRLGWHPQRRVDVPDQAGLGDHDPSGELLHVVRGHPTQLWEYIESVPPRSQPHSGVLTSPHLTHLTTLTSPTSPHSTHSPHRTHLTQLNSPHSPQSPHLTALS